MDRNYAALPFEYLEEMEDLDDAEFGRLIRALLRYSRDGEKIALNGNERFFAKRVMSREDRFEEGFENQKKARSSAGREGAKARWRTIANDGKTCERIANDGKNGYTKANTKANTKNITGDITRARRFTPPTLAEVQAYVSERRSPVDPQGFIDFYEAKGWLVGRTPMKDWKAACRNAETWERWKRPREDSRSANVFLDMLREEEAHGT